MALAGERRRLVEDREAQRRHGYLIGGRGRRASPGLHGERVIQRHPLAIDVGSRRAALMMFEVADQRARHAELGVSVSSRGSSLT